MKENPGDLTLSETCSNGGSKIRKIHKENLRKQIWVEHTFPVECRWWNPLNHSGMAAFLLNTENACEDYRRFTLTFIPQGNRRDHKEARSRNQWGIQTRTTVRDRMAYKNLNLSATECRNCGPAPDRIMNKKDLTPNCNKLSSIQPPIFIFKCLAPMTAFGEWPSLPMERFWNCVSLTVCLPDFFQFDEVPCCLNQSEGYRHEESSETQTQTTAAETMPCTLILYRKESLWTRQGVATTTAVLLH